MKIKVDSREQEPLPFVVGGNVSNVSTIGLPFGDYWCELEDGTEIPIVFERKSIQDLYGTLTSGHDRFKRELERAKRVDCQLFLIIEGSLTQVLKGTPYSQVNPDTLTKSVFTFKVKYELQPIFCTSRAEMMRYMIETWEAFGRNFAKKN